MEKNDLINAINETNNGEIVGFEVTKKGKKSYGVPFEAWVTDSKEINESKNIYDLLESLKSDALFAYCTICRNRKIKTNISTVYNASLSSKNLRKFKSGIKELEEKKFIKTIIKNAQYFVNPNYLLPKLEDYNEVKKEWAKLNNQA